MLQTLRFHGGTNFDVNKASPFVTRRGSFFQPLSFMTLVETFDHMSLEKREKSLRALE